MRLKLLNGAPLCEHLDFSEGSLLSVDRCKAFHATARQAASNGEHAAEELKWRHLAAKNTRLHTGWSQPYLPGNSQADITLSFSIPNIGQSSILPEFNTSIPDDTTATFLEDETEVDGYLEHSLTFHSNLVSSQIAQDDNTISSSSFLTTSFGTTTSEPDSPSTLNEHAILLQVSPTMSVTALASLPSAQHIRSIYPQTPTPNLLCALMTTPERREVFVRKGAYNMNLWEITVADDTASNFKVSFWLRPPRESNNEQANAQSLLLQTLERARVGDILLLRNIALTSFRDAVYGQSLNPAITRARTNIDVLASSSGVAVAQLGGLPAAVVETFVRVKRWARAHVAADSAGVRKRKGSLAKRDGSAKRLGGTPLYDDSLPPDTMEGL
ncbi:hypothetical protein P153DRAFT_375154 [Dothidotthia symphoricarpi CBS 119687]|uniref:Uncharacterized protein n=1 Tax=Dothidotthia symphoricarpi CBS 119687 TaxID=1392245 RepID=A0A6A6AGM8_9PLEO|nr:uncharacterized protein P153DRAFT_375154 [Dothidotthia symphoricarpi CBS 119687]KAF2130393.1 hypothetical protein P153DRAFT_375154 [Dothidotthia symphoricarpi CBS 119687]